MAHSSVARHRIERRRGVASKIGAALLLRFRLEGAPRATCRFSPDK